MEGWKDERMPKIWVKVSGFGGEGLGEEGSFGGEGGVGRRILGAGSVGFG